MAKKKRRRGTRSPGVDPNEQRRQRLEARRQAKAEAEARRFRQQRRERIVRRLVYLGIIVFLLWFILGRNRYPDEIAGHEVEHFATSGTTDGQPTHVEGTVNYESTPPVSGSHAPSPAVCGTHAQQIPNENQVHSLEHGAVGIQYAPDFDPAEIEKIEALVREFDEDVFSGPYAGLNPPIAMTAWGFKMNLSTFDQPAIREFIDEFAGGGAAPEASQLDCTSEAEESFSPEAEASPSPGGDEDTVTVSPPPEPSPTE